VSDQRVEQGHRVTPLELFFDLVFVSAFTQVEGESLNELNARFPASRFGEVISPYTFPTDGTGEAGVEAEIAPEDYPTVFAAGMPADAATVAAVSQRPIAVSALFMAARAGAETVELDTSHAAMVVEPRAVTKQIRAALHGVTAAVSV